MGTNRASFVDDLFLYSHQVDLKINKINKKKLIRAFKFTLCYIHDVLSLNNSRFGYYVDRIYPMELVITSHIDTARCTYTLIYT